MHELTLTINICIQKDSPEPKGCTQMRRVIL